MPTQKVFDMSTGSVTVTDMTPEEVAEITLTSDQEIERQASAIEEFYQGKFDELDKSLMNVLLLDGVAEEAARQTVLTKRNALLQAKADELLALYL